MSTSRRFARTRAAPHAARILGGLLCALALLGPARASAPAIEVGLELVAKGLTQPVMLVSPPGDERRFIVEQIGRIRVLTPDGELLEEPFLDIRDRLVDLDVQFDERGLLGLAFHPDFAENGRFFVHYTAALRADADMGKRLFWNSTTHISEFRVGADDPNRADPESERFVLRVDQPQPEHNAGALTFGPDGYLYVALGDGGNLSDVGPGHAPEGNGQATDTLLGKILRIDVDRTEGDAGYAVPDDNPFVGVDGYRPEIWALGLRNPFRCSFDAGGEHALFCADVGQGGYEEVDLITKGGNYGWRLREGFHCFDPEHPYEHPKSCPDVDGLIDPIIEYGNCSAADPCAGRSIAGGYVYRGSAIPELQGRYLFGDWSAAMDNIGPPLFAAARPNGADGAWITSPLEVTNLDFRTYVLSFGQDAAGEIYVLTSDALGPDPTKAKGKVYKIVPAT